MGIANEIERAANSLDLYEKLGPGSPHVVDLAVELVRRSPRPLRIVADILIDKTRDERTLQRSGRMNAELTGSVSK